MSSTDPFELSLEELMSVEVVSVSKRAQQQFTTPAAVHVITAADIERAGATSLGEALRGTPGLQVARTNRNDWAISVRGFNGTFANKLLVLIDGRTVYNPYFAGVYWDNQEIVMADVERIEVIRGPGAAVWGANAVNGVINVITKHSRETQAVRVASSISEHHRIVSMRYGDAPTEQFSYRVHARYADRELLNPIGVDASSEDYHANQVGLRLDYAPTARDQFTLSADLLDRDAATWLSGMDPSSGQTVQARSEGETNTGNLLVKWRRDSSASSSHELQFFSNHYSGDGGTGLGTEFDTYDLSYQHSLSWSGNQHLVWGLGYRCLDYKSDDLPGRSFQPDEGIEHNVSFFFHNESTFLNGRATAGYGLRLEDNDRGGTALQPNLRLGYSINERMWLWGSIGRATRTPSISENDINVIGFPVPPSAAAAFPVPVVGSLVGSNDLDSETLDAIDVGFRWQVSEQFTLDLTAFANRYEDLILTELGDITCVDGRSFLLDPSCVATSPLLLLHNRSQNAGDANSHGIEISAQWKMQENLTVQMHYGYLDVEADGTDPVSNFVAGLFSGSSPKHSASLSWSYSPIEHWRVGGQVRHVSRLEQQQIPSYTVLDLSLSWHPRPGMRLALVGQDLGDRQHEEFLDAFDSTLPTGIERSLIFQFEISL